jgi:nitroreductase/2-polyprenyl-3-methyl-5-hydroxy-6-metoxy-1,4-benzoquinol methylase
MVPDESSSPTPGSERPPAGGIPEQPVGTPVFGQKSTDADEGRPVGPTPAFDFWRAIYERRSIRKFKGDAVPRELVAQVIHAGIWAPSSCNYQMWDFVAVDDPAVNARLAALSSQMGNAPVNIVVSYGRDFSEDAWANIQSASAAIENMSLAAHVLGLGTFWITQTGDPEKVRALVGLPEDRIVVAVLALGYPKLAPRSGPKRRPLAHVSHWNYYSGKPIPSSVRPDDWEPDLLAVYQRARVLNGLRHNKPRAWETRALVHALDKLVPEGKQEPVADAVRTLRWLDVLPCTGILTERLARERPGFQFDVVERTQEVAEFVSARTRPRASMFVWPPKSDERLSHVPIGAYDVVSCLFRLENLRPDDRARLLHDMAQWIKPGGQILLGFVNAASFHDLTEWLRSRRASLKGVEYVLSPDPNIGPFEALETGDVKRMSAQSSLRVSKRVGLQAVPQPEEIAFRTRNMSPRSQSLARALGWTLSKIEKTPGLQSSRGRFQFWSLSK